MTSSLSVIKEALSPESRTMRCIGKITDASVTALSETAATISEQLYDHHLVDEFTGEQERLQDEADLLRAELRAAKRSQGAGRGVALRALKVDATSLRTRTEIHVSAVDRLAQLQVENRKKALEEGHLSDESCASWHPVSIWDTRLIDAINTGSVTLVEG